MSSVARYGRGDLLPASLDIKHRSSQNKQAYESMRPRTASDWKQLRSLSIYLAVIAFCVCVLFIAKNNRRHRLEDNWQSVKAIVEDARTVIATQAQSQGGGAMLYNVEVLAKYSEQGVPRERWITVEQLPELLADAQLQIFRWKGKTCLVRWNPTNREQVLAELS